MNTKTNKAKLCVQGDPISTPDALTIINLSTSIATIIYTASKEDAVSVVAYDNPVNGRVYLGTVQTQGSSRHIIVTRLMYKGKPIDLELLTQNSIKPIKP